MSREIACTVFSHLSETPLARGQRLMTIPGVAEYLVRTVGGVEHLIEQGRLPVVRLDSKVQIDRWELNALISRMTA